MTTQNTTVDWFALVLGAAASIEDAANSLTDQDALRQAKGAAKHYRDAAQRLYASPQPAAPQPDDLEIEIVGLQNTVIRQGEMLAQIVNIIRGEPAEGCAHSTHDAVDLVYGLKMHSDQYAMAVEHSARAAPQPVAVPVGFEWPKPPPRKGQSDVLFDDGYDEGWAMCIESMKSLLAAAPQAPSREPLTDAQIELAAHKATKAGQLSWLGFKKDEMGSYSVPVLSPSDYQFARAIERAHGITKEGGKQ